MHIVILYCTKCTVQNVTYYRSFQNNLNDYRTLSKVHPKMVQIVSCSAEQ